MYTIEQIQQMQNTNKKTIEQIKDNLITFNGNNLNPIPDELFLLWKKLVNKYQIDKSMFKDKLNIYDDRLIRNDIFLMITIIQ